MVHMCPAFPPDSMPSAITAVTPAASIFLAWRGLATTGRTWTPASRSMGMNRSGLPAPVVMAWMPSLHR